MKIKSIYINGLHNAVNKTYEFNDIVYIFGNNGAGKSTILQAIQYALLGYIPGTAKNSKEAILRHSPQNSITVRLELCEVAGDVNTVYIERSINKNINSVEISPSDYDISAIIKELELPIFNFNEFVGQTANKLKEYFIKNILPTVDGNLDWEQILSDSIIDCNFQDRDEIIKYGLGLVSGLEGDVVDQVIAANARFKEEQTFNKAEIQRLQNTIDSLIFYDDYMGVSDPVALNAEILSLNSLRDQVLKYETTVSTVQSQQFQVDSLNYKLDMLGGKDVYDSTVALLPQLQAQKATLDKSIQDKSNSISALRATINGMESVINSKGICPYTSDSCKSMLTKIDNLRNDLVIKKAEVVEAVAELENLQSDQTTCVHNITTCESTIREFTTVWEKLNVLQTSIGELPKKPDTNKTLPEIEAEIELLNSNMMKLQANIKYNETIDNITKLKYVAELKKEALACWVKKTDTNGLQTTLMVKPFEELAASMTNYIASMYGRDDIKAHFNISTKANSFSFGLIRGGVYIPYDMLSSGEKCLYSLALMICIINNNKSPLKVMLCDDMFDHLDNQAIENTFEALKLYNVVAERDGRPKIQFIFAGVKACENAKDVLLQM